MSKKIIGIGMVLFLFLAAFSVYSGDCPGFADTEEKFLNILRLALQDRLEKGGRDKAYSQEIKDLMQFYAVADWNNPDCSVKGKETGKTIKEVLENVYGRVSKIDILRCEDKTPYGECSPAKPKYCFFGKLTDKCSVCGCAAGLICHEERCKTPDEVKQCKDGTKDEACSVQKPMFCDKGTLVYDCERCGCYEGENCDKAAKLCFVQEARPCKVPAEGMLIGENTVLCEGIYHLSQGLVITGSEISLDCNGAVLKGNGFGAGLTATRSSYVSMKNCKVVNYEHGLLVTDASNIAANGNEFRDNVFGVYVNNSNNNEFTNNVLIGNVNYSFYLEGSSNNIILKNSIYDSGIYDKNEAVNVYCRQGAGNDYYSNAKGPVCKLPNCGNKVCDKDENCFNCEDCACEKGELCINMVCKKAEKKLSSFQVEACKSADKAKTCDRLQKLGLVTAEQCCAGLGKCC